MNARVTILGGILGIFLPVLSATAKGPVYLDVEQAGLDYQLQGEYQGLLGGTEPIGIQVIALGDGQFRGRAYFGGLPGDGWDGNEPAETTAKADGAKVAFAGDFGTATADGKTLVIRDPGGDELGRLERVERKSPTLGRKPPEGAIVLFDGSHADAFEGGRISDDGLLQQGVTSNQKFGSHHLHLEFRLPFQPADRGQARGNSGVYLQGRYEVQLLDSFGLEGEQNECGGIYSVRAPAINMCFPPLTWQTYDIDYTAATYDDNGQVTSPPRMTVRHNGIVIHDDVELPANRSTTAAPVPPGPAPGPLYLQDHGCPVQFRNIWIKQ